MRITSPARLNPNRQMHRVRTDAHSRGRRRGRARGRTAVISPEARERGRRLGGRWRRSALSPQRAGWLGALAGFALVGSAGAMVGGFLELFRVLVGWPLPPALVLGMACGLAGALYGSDE